MKPRRVSFSRENDSWPYFNRKVVTDADGIPIRAFYSEENRQHGKNKKVSFKTHLSYHQCQNRLKRSKQDANLPPPSASNSKRHTERCPQKVYLSDIPHEQTARNYLTKLNLFNRLYMNLLAPFTKNKTILKHNVELKKKHQRVTKTPLTNSMKMHTGCFHHVPSYYSNIPLSSILKDKHKTGVENISKHAKAMTKTLRSTDYRYKYITVKRHSKRTQVNSSKNSSTHTRKNNQSMSDKSVNTIVSKTMHQSFPVENIFGNIDLNKKIYNKNYMVSNVHVFRAHNYANSAKQTLGSEHKNRINYFSDIYPDSFSNPYDPNIPLKLTPLDKELSPARVKRESVILGSNARPLLRKSHSTMTMHVPRRIRNKKDKSCNVKPSIISPGVSLRHQCHNFKPRDLTVEHSDLVWGKKSSLNILFSNKRRSNSVYKEQDSFRNLKRQTSFDALRRQGQDVRASISNIFVPIYNNKISILEPHIRANLNLKNTKAIKSSTISKPLNGDAAKYHAHKINKESQLPKYQIRPKTSRSSPLLKVEHLNYTKPPKIRQQRVYCTKRKLTEDLSQGLKCMRDAGSQVRTQTPVQSPAKTSLFQRYFFIFKMGFERNTRRQADGAKKLSRSVKTVATVSTRCQESQIFIPKLSQTGRNSHKYHNLITRDSKPSICTTGLRYPLVGPQTMQKRNLNTLTYLPTRQKSSISRKCRFPLTYKRTNHKPSEFGRSCYSVGVCTPCSTSMLLQQTQSNKGTLIKQLFCSFKLNNCRRKNNCCKRHNSSVCEPSNDFSNQLKGKPDIDIKVVKGTKKQKRNEKIKSEILSSDFFTKHPMQVKSSAAFIVLQTPQQKSKVKSKNIPVENEISGVQCKEGVSIIVCKKEQCTLTGMGKAFKKWYAKFTSSKPSYDNSSTAKSTKKLKKKTIKSSDIKNTIKPRSRGVQVNLSNRETVKSVKNRTRTKSKMTNTQITLLKKNSLRCHNIEKQCDCNSLFENPTNETNSHRKGTLQLKRPKTEIKPLMSTDKPNNFTANITCQNNEIRSTSTGIQPKALCPYNNNMLIPTLSPQPKSLARPYTKQKYLRDERLAHMYQPCLTENQKHTIYRCDNKALQQNKTTQHASFQHIISHVPFNRIHPKKPTIAPLLKRCFNTSQLHKGSHHRYSNHSRIKHYKQNKDSEKTIHATNLQNGSRIQRQSPSSDIRYKIKQYGDKSHVKSKPLRRTPLKSKLNLVYNLVPTKTQTDPGEIGARYLINKRKILPANITSKYSERLASKPNKPNHKAVQLSSMYSYDVDFLNNKKVKALPAKSRKQKSKVKSKRSLLTLSAEVENTRNPINVPRAVDKREFHRINSRYKVFGTNNKNVCCYMCVPEYKIKQQSYYKCSPTKTEKKAKHRISRIKQIMDKILQLFSKKQKLYKCPEKSVNEISCNVKINHGILKYSKSDRYPCIENSNRYPNTKSTARRTVCKGYSKFQFGDTHVRSKERGQSSEEALFNDASQKDTDVSGRYKRDFRSKVSCPVSPARKTVKWKSEYTKFNCENINPSFSKATKDIDHNISSFYRYPLYKDRNKNKSVCYKEIARYDPWKMSENVSFLSKDMNISIIESEYEETIARQPKSYFFRKLKIKYCFQNKLFKMNASSRRRKRKLKEHFHPQINTKHQYHSTFSLSSHISIGSKAELGSTYCMKSIKYSLIISHTTTHTIAAKFYMVAYDRSSNVKLQADIKSVSAHGKSKYLCRPTILVNGKAFGKSKIKVISDASKLCRLKKDFTLRSQVNYLQSVCVNYDLFKSDGSTVEENSGMHLC